MPVPRPAHGQRRRRRPTARSAAARGKRREEEKGETEEDLTLGAYVNSAETGVGRIAGIELGGVGRGRGSRGRKQGCRRRIEPPGLDSAGEEGEELEAELPVGFDLCGDDGGELGNHGRNGGAREGKGERRGSR